MSFVRMFPRSRYRRRWKKRVIAIIVAVSLLAAGILWQHISLSLNFRSIEAPGQFAQVNGHSVHYYKSGEGNRSIVFLAGSGTPCAYTDFYHLQKALSGEYTTLSYDKPGFGWSEGTKDPRDVGTQVEELHALLAAAGLPGPHILVAHSLSSLDAIHYAQQYPEKVAGIVLLDAGAPDYYKTLSQTGTLLSNRATALARSTGALRLLSLFGIHTPLLGDSLRQAALPDDIQKIDSAMFLRHAGTGKNIPYIKSINENARTVLDGGVFGDLPILSLVSGAVSHNFLTAQRDFSIWTRDFRIVLLDGASHYIHLSNPQEVLEEIQVFAGSI